MSKENGGPAFTSKNPAEFVSGMTLRDYFAAKAMAAMIPAFYEDKLKPDANLERAAYQIADAMLAERAK